MTATFHGQGKQKEALHTKATIKSGSSSFGCGVDVLQQQQKQKFAPIVHHCTEIAAKTITPRPGMPEDDGNNNNNDDDVIC